MRVLALPGSVPATQRARGRPRRGRSRRRRGRRRAVARRSPSQGQEREEGLPPIGARGGQEPGVQGAPEGASRPAGAGWQQHQRARSRGCPTSPSRPPPPAPEPPAPAAAAAAPAPPPEPPPSPRVSHPHPDLSQELLPHSDHYSTILDPLRWATCRL